MYKCKLSASFFHLLESSPTICTSQLYRLKNPPFTCGFLFRSRRVSLRFNVCLFTLGARVWFALVGTTLNTVEPTFSSLMPLASRTTFLLLAPAAESDLSTASSSSSSDSKSSRGSSFGISRFLFSAEAAAVSSSTSDSASSSLGCSTFLAARFLDFACSLRMASRSWRLFFSAAAFL